MLRPSLLLAALALSACHRERGPAELSEPKDFVLAYQVAVNGELEPSG